jgi:tetratricopeptide (TPR) repeat protein
MVVANTALGAASTNEEADPSRIDIADQIRAAVEAHQCTNLRGRIGLGQHATICLALSSLPKWHLQFASGRWLTGGYLAGLHDLVSQSLIWAESAAPDLVARHEQTLKRIWPARRSTAYRVPRDLTNTSDREERTRFYHYEYQNKLLVGLAEFLLAVLRARRHATLLVISDADCLSPTSSSLIEIIQRQPGSREWLRFILMDGDSGLFASQSDTISVPGFEKEDFYRHLDLTGAKHAQRELIYALSRGNLRVGRALKYCAEAGVGPVGNISAIAIIDLYLASLPTERRLALAVEYIQKGFSGDLIAERNAETISPALLDPENMHQSALALERYRRGIGPLVLAHALAISDGAQRIEALVEPCETLMAIGLYDTWFSFFASIFSDPDLRSYGDGNNLVNGLFINAAFVLYAMGYSRVSVPFLEEFFVKFPESRFIPTVLYAQSMTYGRYQIPVDLERAEICAIKNIDLIDGHFRTHRKYTYIKVFAENAYAYIKARQGKFSEALELCECGNEEILGVYGESSYRLHRSILIYNTSQVYEIVGDLVKAEAKLREAIALDPYYAEYHNDLGNLLSKVLARESEALEAYAQAIALSPPYYEAHLNRGILRAQIGDLAGAQSDFERVLEIKPQEWRALREIGNIRLMAGDAAGALESYLCALRHEERDADLQTNAGLACSELDDGEGAVQHYHSAIAVNPLHADAHNNLAAELVKYGRYDEALKHAQLAAKHGQNPDFARNLTAIEALCARSLDS